MAKKLSYFDMMFLRNAYSRPPFQGPLTKGLRYLSKRK